MQKILTSTPSFPETIHNLDQWVLEMISHYIKGQILEIGSETGDFAQLLITNGFRLRLSSLHGKTCRLLEERFKDNPSIKGVRCIKPLTASFDELHSKYFSSFDTVLFLNATENDPGDQMIQANLKKLVTENGHLILQVPVQIALFNETGHGIEGWRQANRDIFKKLLGGDFGLLDAWVFNASKDKSSEIQSVPSFQIADQGICQRVGLSAIVIGKKKPVKRTDTN